MKSGDHAEKQSPGLLRRLLSFLILVVVVLACAWAMRTFVITPYEIPSESMETTIEVGDKVFAEKISYYFRSVEPGDIVTFADPDVPSRTLIKRCIAVGGQTINLVDGQVYVDGELLDEDYVNGLPTYPLTTALGVEISYPYTIPEGYIWVMGDNRINSSDSRHFGPIAESSVSGRGFFTYLPLDRIGLLE